MPVERLWGSDPDNWSNWQPQCIDQFHIAHLRDDEGYKSIWFDEEHVSYEAQTYKYSVTPTIEGSSLYFTAESSYQYYTPEDTCRDPNDMNVPFVNLFVTNKNTEQQWAEYFYDSNHKPILVEPSEYSANDEFEITVYWYWSATISRDFTVKLYALLDDNTWITNIDGYANQINMDGSEPSDFLTSEWRNGVTHNHPNDPLRGWIFIEDDYSERQWWDPPVPEPQYYCWDEELDTYSPCFQEEFISLYWDTINSGDFDFDDQEQPMCYDYNEERAFYCTRDAFLDLLYVYCLQDIWIASETMLEFLKLVWRHPWALWYWFPESREI